MNEITHSDVPARKLSLYDLTSDFAALMEADGDDEITNALTEISAGEIEKKAESYCQFLATMEATAETFKAEEQRIANARKAIENKVKSVRDRMKECLLAANIDKLTAGTFKISIALTGGSVVIDDMEKIPATFKTIVHTVTVDKNELKQAIKNGLVKEGAHIEAGTSLRIK